MILHVSASLEILLKTGIVSEISLLRKKIAVLPTVYAENRKELYGIKSYSFFMHKHSKRTPFAV